MSSYDIKLPDEFPFELSTVAGLEAIPADRLKSFQDGINQAVAEKLAAADVSTAKDVRRLPLKDWSALRKAVLGINISYHADGAIIHE